MAATSSGAAAAPKKNWSEADIKEGQGVHYLSSPHSVFFGDFNLSPTLSKGVNVGLMIQKPSMIQERLMSMISTTPHKNLIVEAHNCSGKTTCVAIAVLNRVCKDIKATQALCICPSEAFSMQMKQVVDLANKFMDITVELVKEPTNSANYVPIGKRPPITAQVIIGEPGQILRLIRKKKLGTSEMKSLVFDDADHTLSEDYPRGCSQELMRTVARSSPYCQVLLLASTFNDNVSSVVDKIAKNIFVREYNRMDINKEELYLSSIKQFKVYCPDKLTKIQVIRDNILDLGDKIGHTIIFVRTKKDASTLRKALKEYGWEVTSLPRARNQEHKNKIMKKFEDGLTQVLISIDPLPKGFYNKEVNMVINFDLPWRRDPHTEPEVADYLERVSHAGRFGIKGVAFNLICNNDGDDEVMSEIEKILNSDISEVSPCEEAFKSVLKNAYK